MEDKGLQFYEYVKSKGVSVPGSFEEFQSGLENPDTAAQFMKYLSTKNIETPSSVTEFQDVVLNNADIPKKDVPEKMSFEELMENKEKEKEEAERFRNTPLSPLIPNTGKREGEIDFFDQAITDIDKDFMFREEETVVPELKYRFKDHGFEFDESGVGDNVIVTASNGETDEFNLDSSGDASSESLRLKSFLIKNRGSEDVESMKRIEARQAYETKRFMSQEQVELATKSLNDDMDILVSEEKDLYNVYQEISTYGEKFEGLTQGDLDDNPELKADYDSYKARVDEFQSMSDVLKNNRGDLIDRRWDLTQSVGAYFDMKTDQGEFSSALYNQFLLGIGDVGATGGDIMIDVSIGTGDYGGVTPRVYTDMMLEQALSDERISQEDYDRLSGMAESEEEVMKFRDENGLYTGDFTEAPKELQKSKENSDLILKELKGLLKEEAGESVLGGGVITTTTSGVYDDMESSVKDKLKKKSKYGEDGRWKGGKLESIQNGLVELIGSGNVSDEYLQAQQDSFLGGSLLGLSRSLPAMVAGSITGGSMTTVLMGAQINAAIKEEMANNPEFDDVSENERMAISAPIAIAAGALEAFGIRNMKATSGVMNRLVRRAFTKSAGKQLTAKSFDKIIRDDIKSGFTRGALKLTGAGLAEAETGAAQEFAEVSMKKIYNYIKDEEKFETATGMQWIQDIAMAGAQEAVGGFILGSPGAVVTGLSNTYDEFSNDLPDMVYEAFNIVVGDPKIREGYISSINAQVADGFLTREEADEKIKTFKIAGGIAQSIPSDMRTSEKKQAFKLLYERQVLESSIEGKDKSLTKKEQGQIGEINKKIEALKEKSIKRSTKKEKDFEASNKVIEGINKKISELREKLSDTSITKKEKNSLQKELASLENDLKIEKDKSTETDKQEGADIESFFEGTDGEDGPNFATNSGGKSQVLSDKQEAIVNKIKSRVEKVANSLKSRVPGVRILLHENADEYKRITGKSGGGAYIIEDGKGTIHINLSKARASTLAHEAFHAVFLHKLKTDSNAARAAIAMIKSVEKVLDPNSQLAKDIKAFSALYKDQGEGIQNEEKLAELVGRISSEYKTLSRSSKDKVIDLLKKLANKIGFKFEEDFGKSDQDVIDLLNTLARKFESGEEITEKDVDVIGKDIDSDAEQSTIIRSNKRFQADTSSKSSSVEMFENPDILKPKRMANGRTKVIELGRAFDKRAKENGYYIPIPKDGVYTDNQLNKIAEAMTDDAQQQLQQDDSGIGWYDLKTKSAMELMSRIHPELSNSNSQPHLEFTVLVALISQNNSVGINFRQANEAYTYYKNNNKLPEKPYAGKSGNIIKQNIALAFEAIKSKGWTKFKNTLQENRTVKEWEAEGYSISGENKTTKITGGMAIFGSKIGSFWGNLNGDFNTLTADLWFSRNFNRYTGNVVSKKGNVKSKQTTLDELKKYNGTSLLYGYKKSDILKGTEVFDKWLNTIVKNYADKNYKDKQRLNVVSNTHFKNTKGELQDIPRGGNERNTMRDVVKRVQDKLIERGYPKLDIADIQAILWYNEKDLYALYKAVNKSSEKTDYETAAQEVLRNQGVNAEVALPFQRSKPSTDGGRKQTDTTQPKSLSSEVKKSKKPSSREQKQDTPKTREQIIGENAELSQNVRDNLSVAREMGTANKDTKTIRIATGWEKGADGKWRYEIDDVLIKDDFSYKDLKRIPSGLYSGKLSDVINNEKLFDSYSTRFTQEVDILNDDGSVEDFKRTDNYPPISDIKVYFEEVRGGTGVLAEYNPFFKTITINIQPGNSTNKQISTVLLHEIQHYIQGREGFARGGNSGMFDNEMDTLSFGNVNALRSFAKDVAIKNPEKGWDITYGSDAVKKYEEFFGEKPSPTVVTLASVLEQQLSRGIDLDETTVYKTLKNNNLTSFEKYKRLAGEVESRNVEKRMNMTSEQRRASILEETEDVDRKDQIFFTEEQQTRKQRTDAPSIREDRMVESPSKMTGPQIILEARQNNFSDAAIRDYLIRVRGYSVKQVDEALKFDIDAFESLPQAFRTITGGVIAGLRLYNRVKAYRDKLIKANDRLKNPQLSESEIKAKVAKKLAELKGSVKYGTKTNKQIDDDVRKFRDKEESNNKKRKTKLTAAQVNDRVRTFRENLQAEKQAKTDLRNKAITNFEKTERKANEKRKPRVSEQEIMDKAIEFLEKQPEYLAERETYTVGSEKEGTKQTKFREGLTVAQASLVSAFQSNVGVRPTKSVAEKLKKARRMLRDRKKGARDLNKIKNELRHFIRRALPNDLYKKTEVLKLIKLVTDANEGNIENIFEQVEKRVTEMNNTTLIQKISKMLDLKQYAKKDRNGKIIKGRRIDPETLKRLEGIVANLIDPSMDVDELVKAVEERVDSLQKQIDELNSKKELSVEDVSKIVDLNIAMQYNQSMLLDNDNIYKTAALDSVHNSLEELITFGRAVLQYRINKRHKSYVEQLERMYYDITGNKIDMSQEGAKEKLDEMSLNIRNKAKKDRVDRRLKGIFQKLKSYISFGIEDLSGYMDIISTLPGDIFEGETQEIVTDRIDASTRAYKGRMLQIKEVLETKLMEVYGKSWEKEIQESRKLIEETEAILGYPLSRDQIIYLYNQYRDPSNHSNFKSQYGAKYEEKMEKLFEFLTKEDKEFADYQVNELFPSLYEYYNPIYKRIYDAEMPWSMVYAGPLRYDGVTETEFDLLQGTTSFQKSMAPGSAIKRVNNQRKISEESNIKNMTSYMQEMEYWAAYAENLRDINKLFQNDAIRDAITSIHGPKLMKLIDDSIAVISKKGGKVSEFDRIVNGTNSLFSVTRLALSPVIYLKQLTSAFAYANDIGYRNWVKYSIKNIIEFRKLSKEIMENSIYLKDRYDKSITRTLETYKEENSIFTRPKYFIGDKGISGDDVVSFMMGLVTAGDRHAIIIGGMPNYKLYKDRYMKENPEATEQEAVDYAIIKFEKDTKKAQQSSDLQDKDLAQTGNPIYRSFNMFLTTSKQYLRKEFYAIRQIYTKIRQWDRMAGKGTLGQNLRTLTTFHVVLPMIFQYVTSGLPGLLADWEDEDGEDLLRAAIMGNINGLFILGDFFVAAADYAQDKPWAFDFKNLTVYDIMGEIGDSVKRYQKLKPGPKKEEAYWTMIATIAQAKTIKKWVENLQELPDSKNVNEAIMRLLNYSEYQISGGKKSKKSAPKSSDKEKSLSQEISEFEGS